MPQLLYLLAYGPLVPTVQEAEWAPDWAGVGKKAHHAANRTNYSAIRSIHNLLMTLNEFQGKNNKIHKK